MDYEAIAWAVRKLTAFGVANSTEENAMMMDRLELMLKDEPSEKRDVLYEMGFGPTRFPEM